MHNSTVFGKSESYSVTKVTEYFWQFDAKYELVAFMGNESDKAVVLQQRAGTIELKTVADATPKPVYAIYFYKPPLKRVTGVVTFS